MPNTIPEKPWSHILADFITKLPLAQGYDAILVVCDCFSKMVHFIATMEKTSAEGLAKLFQDHIWKLHGVESPKKEQVSHTFKHLVTNIKLYNADKI